jgi:hypothetical protein
MQQVINNLLDDKLFKVIGSTPKSVSESLLKVNIRNQPDIGAQIFAVAIFAAAVNKATLETFLADPRFVTVRPLISSALSVSGRTNMTAITLLGHCFLTTTLASNVNFSAEFRKKMGQDHLWAGDLTTGSVSDNQKKILLEKKRVTKEEEAKALGSGFLKWVGLDSAAMTVNESKLFPAPAAPRRPRTTTEAGQSSVSTQSVLPRPKAKRLSPTDESIDTETVQLADGSYVTVDGEVFDYRTAVLGQNLSAVVESIARNGLEVFTANTRKMMRDDPDGSRTKAQSRV